MRQTTTRAGLGLGCWRFPERSVRVTESIGIHSVNHWRFSEISEQWIDSTRPKRIRKRPSVFRWFYLLVLDLEACNSIINSQYLKGFRPREHLILYSYRVIVIDLISLFLFRNIKPHIVETSLIFIFRRAAWTTGYLSDEHSLPAGAAWGIGTSRRIWCKAFISNRR